MEDVSKLSDEEIVILVRNEDKELYAIILKRYQEKLLRYANYLLRSEHTASDIVQDSFIKAYINLNAFNTKRKFSSWIYQIVHNEAMNHIKRNRKQISIYQDKDYDSGVDIEDEYIKKELKRRTYDCLDKMPVMYMEPMVLFYLERKLYEEISDILRIPIGTVGTRISRAKILMKKICQNVK